MKKIILISSLLVAGATLMAQVTPVFYNLNTSNGLSYIGVTDLCVDKNGNLWISTGNGLNVFNGKKTEKYYAAEYPELETSNIRAVTCDKNNRVWVLNAEGHVAMFDEKRNLHKVVLREKDHLVKCLGFLLTPGGQIYIRSESGLFQYNIKTDPAKLDSISNDEFKFLQLVKDEKYREQGGSTAIAFDENYYLLVFKSGIQKINFSNNTIESRINIANAHVLSTYGQDELLYFDVKELKLKITNLKTLETTYPLQNLKDQFGKEVTAVINEAKPVNSRQYLLTTQNEGIYIWDIIAGTILNYRHSVADPTSIYNNIQSTIAVGQQGWVFMICNPSGVCYFNNNAFIGNQIVFTDGKGNGFDGYVAGIATKDNNTFYIGTDENLMKWNRSTNTTVFAKLNDESGLSIFRNREVTSVLIDHYGRIWATTENNGIVITDKDLNLIRHIKNDGNNDRYQLKIKNLRRIVLAPDGNVWASGNFGICKINPVTFVVDTLGYTPLARFAHSHVAPLVFTDEDNLWFASFGNGLFHYKIKSNHLDSLKKENGLISNTIFDINYDQFKNIYVGTIDGLNIISPEGRIKTLTKEDGLLIDRAEGLLLDNKNRMWIGNDIGFACYNPADSSLKTFDERYGLSIYGFRVGSYFQLSNGEFILGTPKGIQYFQSDSLYNKKLDLSVSISKMETKNISSAITADTGFRLRANDNQVTFYFGTVDYSPHVRTYYEYKLVDLDKNWIKLVDQNSVRYNSLSPGKYIFKIRISNDNKNWQESDNEVTVIVAAPYYQTWWFRTIAAFISLAIIGYVLKYYKKKQQREKEELESQVVINYFASQINKHNKIDAMLWDIAKNCISRLNFEDCVIYLLDQEKKVLVQKAAWGPKAQRDYTIYQPIEIHIGKGIVGTVAQTGRPELIGNTETDKRYIADDAKRSSELAVPVSIDKKIIGVIDSEHSQKKFFKQKHLNILNTIAVLCAAQIQRVNAEEEKQKAKIEALENKQKVTESRLQSLRLQMNPHFLFNALNSIQQMILANEEIVATRYLSRFSKLLRKILVHSDKEFVSLKEELEILALYIELESIRFKDSFNYKIECGGEIDTDEIRLPTLLIQPFVENAIWHGLMHKEGERNLSIRFSEIDECIRCVVEDNGIGRERANKVKLATGQETKHTSKGIAVSIERLNAMTNGNGIHGSMEIIDLKNESGEPAGTRVEIIFPIQNN